MDKRIFALDITFSVFCFVCVILALTGCSGMQIVTEDDKIAALIESAPKDVNINIVDASYFTGLLEGNSGYYNQHTKTIHSINNACVVEHEIRHATHGLGHDHFPGRLMRCEA